MKRLNSMVKMTGAGLRSILGIIVLLSTISASTGWTSAQTNPSAACQDGTETTLAYSYSNGWLVCVDGDENQGSEQVYSEEPVGSGNFVFVQGGGGWLLPADLTQLAGVDAGDAEAIVSDLSQQLGLARGFAPGPRSPQGRPRPVTRN